ncbi:MAG: transport system ATP-binding protein [Anaerosolibacter sp.]|jgi:ATP-binding cassette subfamily F protein uup|uniref:ABC-F family ATP-binding cassette domain-containing protein n=1 Tax=Anaerosolibacter sp. TaxID=1872527 RepID=UPI00262A6137|nr:ABC-F family ATP-binding cassette domain-containing protein [Anaerosolibacter sp.]MDF2547606.1 transport system ATP-binding protein [Anaerosolibacter sp.]
MNLLNVENISKNYSEKPLLNHINLGINEGDRIGVIGINGTGKSTLLKIIAGMEVPDDGRVMKGSSVVIEYLSQNPYFDPEANVLTQVFKGESAVMKVLRAYEEAIQNPDTPNEMIIKLSHDMDTMNGWSIENEAKTVLTKLGITDFQGKVGTLSGGQRKRIALAAALINPSDLLILDEPTNHLDNDTIDWLEQYLNKRKGALLMITHDRYFLDRVVNEIIELDQGNLFVYKGNYNNFLEKKVEREDIEAATERKRQNLLRNELAWIRRGARARSTKQKARIERFEKLKEAGVDFDEEKLEISVASSRLGRKVIELEHISKAFDGKEVICDFSYTVLRNDRIGIIGPNGRGKSTLINLLAGILQPDQGKIEVGETVKIGMFAQETSHMDDSLRVIEYIREGAEYVKTADGERISASQMLERFLFPPGLQWTPIGRLSGGERRRLHLLRILMEAPNVLLLDEPTNDLDIETLTILEDYLEYFSGAVIAVSHDRYFLDKMADKIFAFKGQGMIQQYTGNYSDYKESSAYEVEHEASEKDTMAKKADAVSKVERVKEKPLKFSFKEQREYEEIDDVIANLEEKIQEIEEKLNNAVTEYTLLQQLSAEKEDLEMQLEEKMERWMYLNELAEKIEKK